MSQLLLRQLCQEHVRGWISLQPVNNSLGMERDGCEIPLKRDKEISISGNGVQSPSLLVNKSCVNAIMVFICQK